MIVKDDTISGGQVSNNKISLTQSQVESLARLSSSMYTATHPYNKETKVESQQMYNDTIQSVSKYVDVKKETKKETKKDNKVSLEWSQAKSLANIAKSTYMVTHPYDKENKEAAKELYIDTLRNLSNVVDVKKPKDLFGNSQIKTLCKIDDFSNKRERLRIKELSNLKNELLNTRSALVKIDYALYDNQTKFNKTVNVTRSR